MIVMSLIAVYLLGIITGLLIVVGIMNRVFK